MKRLLWVTGLLWASLVMEYARPDLLPTGSLLFPLAATLMLWFRSGSILSVCGLVLVVDWIARPTVWPTVPMILPLVATGLLTASLKDTGYSQRRKLIQLVPFWLLPVLATAIAIAGYELPSLPLQALTLQQYGSHVLRVAAVAVPVSMLLSLTCRLADEFGLIRQHQASVY